MASREPTARYGKTGPGEPSPGQSTTGQVTSGASPWHSLPTTPNRASTRSCITPEAPRREIPKSPEDIRSERTLSPQSWRRDTNHPLSQVKKPPKAINPSRLASLSEELAKAEKWEDPMPSASGRSGRELPLSRTQYGSEILGGMVSQGGTIQQKDNLECISSKSGSPLQIRSFAKTISEAGEEQSLLLSRSRGKQRRGSQDLSSSSGEDSSPLAFPSAEQVLHCRATRVCKTHGITSPRAQQKLYIAARKEAVASLQIHGDYIPDENDEGFEGHFMDALALYISVQPSS